jgi:hypothetical protein
MRPTLRLFPEGTDSCDARVVSCIQCKLKVTYVDRQAPAMADLLATHWADDHRIPGWLDAASKARERLSRRHPDVLGKLTIMWQLVGDPHDWAG